ncbi:MAG: glycosyltransferase family 9 protein [Candidatus Hodarchaeota archaeon]
MASDESILSYLKYTLRRPFLAFVIFLGRFIGKYFDKSLDKSRVHKILVIQFGGIGDVIRIFPSLYLLIHEFPRASISVLTEFDEKMFNLFANKIAISTFVQLDPKKRHKSFFSKLRLIKSLREQNFDLILHPGYGYGMMEFSIISWLIGAPYRIGFKKNGAGFLNTTKIELLEETPIVEQQVDLLSEAGIGQRNHNGEQYMCIKEDYRVFARKFYDSHGLANHELVVTIHPGSKWEIGGRSWSLEKYKQLIEEIVQKYGAKVIILGSHEEDLIARTLKDKIANENIRTNVINAAGYTTIGQAGAIIASSNLFVGNDSGLLHIAIGYNVPAVGIFGFTASKQVIPSNCNCISVETDLSCRPCYCHQPLFKFNCKSPACLTRISVMDVMKHVSAMLDNTNRDTIVLSLKD